MAAPAVAWAGCDSDSLKLGALAGEVGLVADVGPFAETALVSEGLVSAPEPALVAVLAGKPE